MEAAKKALLEDTELFVLDMDGTFFMGQTVIDGALDFIEAVLKKGKKFLFFTNNSSKAPEDYIKKLTDAGCPICRDQIMTSGDIVLVGFDMTLTYEKLERCCTFIRSGALFLATHPDINCPIKEGFIPDCGAICAAISLSTEKRPKYLGKPYRETVEMIFDKTKVPIQKTAFVGDRLYTDIATGVNHGGRGFLVLTGEATLEDVAVSEIKPTAIFESLGEMAQYFRKM